MASDTETPRNEDQSSAPLLRKVQENGFPSRISWRDFLSSDVDPDYSTGPLAVYCFLTGFIDALSFTAAFVWCGFQTGNFAQFALALARLENPRDFVFYVADWQALTSLVAFNAGAFIGRIGDRIGPHTRQWLISGTVAQAVFTIIAGICIQQSGQGSIAVARGEPSWTNGLTSVGLALMAASLGLQGIMAKRLNTQFSTTVVLTAMWVELFADPQLFHRRKTVSRDHKVLALVALFAGALLARLLLGKIGAPATLGFGAGIRLFVAAAWVFVRGKGEGYMRLYDEQPQDESDPDLSSGVATYGAV
ncbi:hypothetical protein DFH07DRAFT_153547 [Mycena maculata]|uniref:DUF1275 domain protein n=1 Tax=Mycena maculata TaxID=230809 RepID=A0AAD7MSD8_9AGAR|nr:hypothetical protein DFH07DRAFT_153547 [Mycena maculata]